MGLRFSKANSTPATLTAGTYDPTVQAFFSVAGISNPTQRRAVDTLVNDLKVYNIWTKMTALYPFVGGNANAHKYNLKDPRDLNAAFRITFTGGWVHNANGIVPNGTDTIADTNLIPTSSLTNGDTHLAIYNRTNATPAICMGMITNYGSPDSRWLFQDYLNVMYSDHYQYSANRLTTGISDYRGLWVSSRVSNSHKIYRNASVSNSQTTTPTGFSALVESIYIQSFNPLGNQVAPQYASGTAAFASIGSGLTDTDVSNLYTAVQAFNTTLGRQV